MPDQLSALALGNRQVMFNLLLQSAWRSLKPFEEISWVTYIQKLPENSSPEHVWKYLARYITGGPISDRNRSRDQIALGSI